MYIIWLIKLIYNGTIINRTSKCNDLFLGFEIISCLMRCFSLPDVGDGNLMLLIPIKMIVLLPNCFSVETLAHKFVSVKYISKHFSLLRFMYFNRYLTN